MEQSPAHPENPSIQGATPQPRRTYGCLWMFIILIVAAAAIWWFGFRSKGASPGAAASSHHARGGGTVPVVAVPARRGDMPIYLTGLGSAQALNTVTVRARVNG
ncbi:MAG TPA: hypothetical protein VG722_02180, partial [Tepidisphaeraceae bacterium]|nr:hypothetical protein [Tepidisphaeraceae bacterium]